MYLPMLSKREKEMFLELAYNFVNVDGNFSQEERDTISAYCQEAQCTFDERDGIRPIDAIADEINSVSSKRNKQIIIFELVGLAISDGEFDDSERDMINHFSKLVGVESEFSAQCEAKLTQYVDFQMKLNKLVLE